MEGYLSVITNYKHRSTITRLRVSSHHLAIETGRYEGLQRSDRICATCDLGVVDNEQHFLAECQSTELDPLRLCLRQSLSLNDDSSRLEASSVFRLTSLPLSNMDPPQRKHLQQISKLIHTMYEAKLESLEDIEERNNDSNNNV